MKSRTKIKRVLNQKRLTDDDAGGSVGAFVHLHPGKPVTHPSLFPSLLLSCDSWAQGGPYLPGEINSDFNCVDVSNSLLPTRTNFHPLRCQMALNISANHCSTRGELKEMGSAWRVRRAPRCGDDVEDPSYPLSLTPATLHTHRRSKWTYMCWIKRHDVRRPL